MKNVKKYVIVSNPYDTKSSHPTPAFLGSHVFIRETWHVFYEWMTCVLLSQIALMNQVIQI